MKDLTSVKDDMASPNSTKPRREHRGSPLVMGVILIVIGGLLLMVNLGYVIPLSLWRYWPLLLILLGLAVIAAPSRHMSRSGGIWLLATGVYCQVSIMELFDLGWASAWPIFIIAAGLDVILDRERRSCSPQERSSHGTSHEA